MQKDSAGTGGLSVTARVVLLALGWTLPVRGAEYHYLLVLGSQRVPNIPNYSHSFATFVRLRGEGPDPSRYQLETVTISWMPENLKVRAQAVLPEKGQNLTLQESLESAHLQGERVSLWGPYPVQADLYARAAAQEAHLASGRVRYKALDAGYDNAEVSNCIHAVSSITGGPRLRIVRCGWGETASYYILGELEPWILERRRQDWLISLLGLDCYPIIYRDWEHPRSGGIRGRILKVLKQEEEVAPVARALGLDLPCHPRR